VELKLKSEMTALMDLEVINVEECRTGTGRWRNIQESVRVAVLTLCSVVGAQAQAIRALQAQVWASVSQPGTPFRDL
jgi:hypothetical protein